MKIPDNDTSDNNSGIGLIPIERLQIPQKSKRNAPLVEYWHSDIERYIAIFIHLNIYYI